MEGNLFSDYPEAFESLRVPGTVVFAETYISGPPWLTDMTIETTTKFAMGLMLPKHSPMTEMFDLAIQELTDNGAMEKIVGKGFWKHVSRKKAAKARLEAHPVNFQQFSLVPMVGAAACAISAAILVGEIAAKKFGAARRASTYKSA